MAKRIEGWDVIGDVHGRLGALRALLGRLGYREDQGVWRNPTRKAVFIGDLVDRGDEVPGVLAQVKAMADAGEAEVLLGNHEYNLLCWYEPDGEGGFLRKRNEVNRAQAERSLAFFDRDLAARDRYFAWFRKLPIVLERDGARFVHAYWGGAEVAQLAGRRTLEECGWGVPDFRAQPLGRAVERLIKGPEVKLPEELFIRDRQGCVRKDARIKWWVDLEGADLRAALLPDTEHFGGRSLPVGMFRTYEPLDSSDPLVFFGHYGFREFPGILAPNAVCVDVQGPGKDGVGAYRWSGEGALIEQNFIRPDGRKEAR